MSHVLAVDGVGQRRTQPASHLRVSVDRTRRDIIVQTPRPQHQTVCADLSRHGIEFDVASIA